MKTFQVQHDCGCCFTEVQFESRESANAAMKKAGLGSCVTLVDDAGQVVHGVDTFYGVLEEGESTDNPLGRLAQMLQ
jgi:hypothetical protein